MSFIVLSLFLTIFIISVISAAGGGASVPVTAIDLSEKGNDYSMKPGRLSFEFENDLYAIQLRRIYSDSALFLIMDLDDNKQEDITAYDLEYSFNLTEGDKKEIDFDKDGINDILVILDKIGTIDRIRSADFSIKNINKNNSDSSGNGESVSEPVETETQRSVLEPVIISQEENSSFFNSLVNFFKGLFE